MWQWVVCDHDTPWHTIWSMFSCDNVWVCDHDTLWYTIWSMVSCDNVWYVVHYGTLYGPWSHVTMCGMWLWYTMPMAHYMVYGLMWQCGGMWPWYTMAHYMVHGLMWQYVVCDRDTQWHIIWSMVSCDNIWYVTVIHYGTLYGLWSHVTMCGMWYTMAHYMVYGLMWQCVVCDHDTLWQTIWSMFSCDNVGVCDHDTLWCHYMVHGLMWQCVVCYHDTLWHTIWSMVSCDNVWYVTVIHYGTLYGPWSHVTMCGMWPWYTMALYMVHVLMWQCVVCDGTVLLCYHLLMPLRGRGITDQ